MAPITSQALSKTARHFDAFCASAGLTAQDDEARYLQALNLIESILDSTRDTPAREDAHHPLAALLDFLTLSVRDYEERHVPIPVSSPREVLQFLMQQHQLKQSDLPEIGNQSVVSQILSGKRQLNVRQIAALARRFGVSADVFIGSDDLPD